MLRHHMDSNVVIGVFIFKDDDTREACKNYCTAIGHRYEGFLSIVSAGEIAKIFGSIPERLAREEAFIFLSDFIFRQKVRIVGIEESDIILARELKPMNHLCDIPELVSLAVAIRQNAEVFMTLDEEMLNERFRGEVQKLYRIAIQKPRYD
ncbi:MAG: PIN domain-containing protein [Candidatus Aenigmarchaeota archaeon]|nr:PIN domain-containing protein [Candidatus Aenigmarchaeota archaeon]